VPAGVPTTYTSFVDIAGTSTHDAATEDEMVRTGRLPEGTYRACVTITDLNRFVVAEECADFTIVYPDPPLLVAPADGESLTTPDAFFEWTPLQVPAEFEVRYILQIAELLPTQTPEDALSASVPFYVNTDVGGTILQYPIDAPPLSEGAVYAWRVMTLDQNGYAPTSNGGRSEIRTFTFDPRAGGTSTGGTRSITMSMSNAFDAGEPEGSSLALSSTSSGSTTESLGFDEICDRWSDPPSEFSLAVNSPLGFKRFAGQPAALYQQETPTLLPAAPHKSWWIETTSPNGRRDVLIGGGCDRVSGKTKIHWIASYNETLQGRINALLAGPVGSALTPGGTQQLNFGMVVLSLGSHEVSVPAEFTEGVEFLGDREVDVATGLNLYAEIGLEEFFLWPFFQSIGFTEKQIALYGFLGWNATWSLGGTIGSGPSQADLSTERQVLLVTGKLPQRTPVGPLAGLVKSTGFELEISIGDSTGRAWQDTTTNRASGLGALRPDEVTESLDLVIKLIHRIVVNDSLEFVGSLGLDFSRQTDRSLVTEALQRMNFMASPGAAASPEYGVDVIISYGASSRLALGSRGRVHLDAVNMDLKFPLDEPSSKQEFMISGEVGVGPLDGLGKLGLAIAYEKPIDTTKVKLELQQARVDRSQEAMHLTAAQTGDCIPGEPVPAAKAKWCDLDARVKNMERQIAAARAAPRNPDGTPKKPSPYSWRLRASLGHTSFKDLITALKEGG
jgi:hypothetical protein